MEIDKECCLETAVEIVKEYARGGGNLSPAGVLETVYKTLKELQIDTKTNS